MIRYSNQSTNSVSKGLMITTIFQELRYIFIGGEAILPSQMEKFRKTAKRLGIQHIFISGNIAFKYRHKALSLEILNFLI